MKLTFLRHAESKYNLNLLDDVDVTITEIGKEQASQCIGHYDIVICSPLKRCQETLDNSKITYDKLIIEPLCREIISVHSDILVGEIFEIESEENVTDRVNKFKTILHDLGKITSVNILVISHADFIWNFTSYWINDEQFGHWLDNAEFLIYS